MSDWEKEIEKGQQLYKIPLHELNWLKKQSEKHSILHQQLLEYMGYDEEYLISAKGLKKKLSKDELVQMVLEQRNMIRKLIDDLEPSKRDKHIAFLDNLYMNKVGAE